MLYKNLPETFFRFVKSLPNNFKPLKGRVSSWIYLKNKQYEDLVGLSEVKAAQNRVLQSEIKFVKSQEDRRDIQRKISLVQLKLHELHAELDRFPRGHDKYPALVTKEHSVLKEEQHLKEEFQLLEKEERENFTILSHTLRDSHEKERAQAEKTKYLSIIGSVLGAVIGVLGSTINNHFKMKKLEELVENATTNNIMNKEELTTNIFSAIEQHLQHKKSQDFPEERWKALKSSLLKIIQHECDIQTKTILELSQQLKASRTIVTGDLDTTDVEKPYVISAQQSIKTLLDRQKQQSYSLLAISAIVIPTCILVLSKVLNP